MIRKVYEIIKDALVKIALTSKKYHAKDFNSFLQKKAHEKTFEILNDELSSSLIFENKYEFWDFCLDETINNSNMEIEKNLILEFGVGAGNSINYFANKLSKHSLNIYGFDSFFGNPEIWPGSNNTIGSSTQFGEIPKNLEKNVIIIKGKIEDTLIEFQKKNVEKIAIIHIDVNIYSTAKFILEKTKDKLQSGTIIIFDELVNYHFWWKKGEFKALKEVFSDDEFEFIAFDNAKKAAIKIK